MGQRDHCFKVLQESLAKVENQEDMRLLLRSDQRPSKGRPSSSFPNIASSAKKLQGFGLGHLAK